MQKGIFGLLLFALCLMPTLASAQNPPPEPAQENPAPVTNEYGFLSSPSVSFLSDNNFPDTRFPAAIAQALGEFGTTAVSALPNIMALRRSYTPPIDMTTVLSAQY